MPTWVGLDLVVQFLYPGAHARLTEDTDGVSRGPPQAAHGVEDTLGQGLPRPLQHHQQGHPEHLLVFVVRNLETLDELGHNPGRREA